MQTLKCTKCNGSMFPFELKSKDNYSCIHCGHDRIEWDF